MPALAAVSTGAALGQARAALPRSRPPAPIAAPAGGTPRAGAPRVQATRAGGGLQRARVVVALSHREEEGAAHPHDLSWEHVARDVRQRLAAAAQQERVLDQLQAWMSEADLRQRGESDLEERSQAEEVAAEEAAHQGLADAKLDVRSWLSEGGGGSSELEGRMAGALVMRLLQAYHKEAGEPFDDESEDAYWRLQGFVPGFVFKALDQPTLVRLIKAYLSLPFSGV